MSSKQRHASSQSEANLQPAKGRMKKMAARAGMSAPTMSASVSASTLSETEDAADLGLLEAEDRSTAWSAGSEPLEGGLEESGPEPVPFDVDSRAQATAFFAELERNKKHSEHDTAKEPVASAQLTAEDFRQQVLATVQGVCEAMEQRLQGILERGEEQLLRSQESQVQSQSRLAENLRNFSDQLSEIHKQLRMGPISELVRLDRTCRKELEELRVERDKVSLMLACIPQTIDQRITEVESGGRKRASRRVVHARKIRPKSPRTVRNK